MGVGGVYEVQVRINKDSGIPEDATTNTFHFARTDLLPWAAGDWTTVKGWLTTFYSTITPVLSSACVDNLYPVKAYNTGDPSPRAPQFVDVLTPGASPGASAGPDELAVCLSYQAGLVSGTSQARRRGRVFIGPLINPSGQRPSSTVITAVRNAGIALLASSTAHATMRWVVYSRVNNGIVYVTNGWVDDAFDVQRRRGLKPVSRNVF
jgi:hypothetical protein